MNKLWIAALLMLAGCNTTTPYTPTVKVIGDSISKAYLPVVQKNLKNQFEVSHACAGGNETNCNNGQTGVILAHLDSYFSSSSPDVVTYNSGIHDMSKSLKDLKMSCAYAAEITPPGRYFENLTRIADFLKEHARVVIWVDTTTLPDNLCASTHLADYNSLGEQVARDHGFYILRLDSKFHDPEGIHFTERGYQYLGKQVSDCIVTAWTSQTTDACERTNW